MDTLRGLGDGLVEGTGGNNPGESDWEIGLRIPGDAWYWLGDGTGENGFETDGVRDGAENAPSGGGDDIKGVVGD